SRPLSTKVLSALGERMSMLFGYQADHRMGRGRRVRRARASRVALVLGLKNREAGPGQRANRPNGLGIESSQAVFGRGQAAWTSQKSQETPNEFVANDLVARHCACRAGDGVGAADVERRRAGEEAEHYRHHGR